MKKNGDGTTLRAEEIQRLRELVDEHGAEGAAALLEVCSNTLARAVAGFGLRRGTRVMIRVGLAAHGQFASSCEDNASAALREVADRVRELDAQEVTS